MTKEQLVGRKVLAGNVTYTLIEVNGKLGLISAKIPNGYFSPSSPYTIINWNSYIKNDTWELLPLEQEIYTTPKGIKYGVGTKFTTGTSLNGELVVTTIDKITTDKVYVSIPTFKTYYSFDVFAKNLDRWPAKIVQNTLNNNKMKEVIEVGDVVEYKNAKQYGHHEYTVDNVYNDILTFKETGYIGSASLYKVLHKTNKQEVIGYELLKDLPGIPKGSKSTAHNGVWWGFGSDTRKETSTNHTFTKLEVQDTTWFKPIYKAQDIELVFSKYNATLSKEHGLVFSGGESISYNDVKSLTTKLQTKAMSFGKAAKFDVTISMTIKEVIVGCKTFNEADIKLITEAITKLEEAIK